MSMEAKPLNEQEKALAERAASALRAAKEAHQMVYPAGYDANAVGPIIGSLAAAIYSQM